MKIRELAGTIKPNQKRDYLIGFYNNGHWDETELTASDISELENLYNEFCKENGITNDTVYSVIESENFENVIYRISEQTEDIHDYEDMVNMAKRFLERDCLPAAANIINALLNNSTCEYYKYDYSMGSVETPVPIYNVSDLRECFPPDEFGY